MISRTAIIVNSRGEAFVGWRSLCCVEASGFENYSSSPCFEVPVKIELTPKCLIPFGMQVGDRYWVNPPYVFSSTRSALRALDKISRYVSKSSLAIVS
jgi:hypothetical protein